MARQIVDPDRSYQVDLNGGTGDQRDLVIGSICASLIDDLPPDDQRPVAVVAAAGGPEGTFAPYIAYLKDRGQLPQGFAEISIPFEPAIEPQQYSDYAFEFKSPGRTTGIQLQQPPARSEVTVTIQIPRRIAENVSPRPADRVVFTYNFFNLSDKSSAAGREIERTMMDTQASIDMRMPFQAAAPTSPAELTLFFNDIGVGHFVAREGASAFSIIPEGFVVVEASANPLAPLHRSARMVDRSPSHHDRLKRSHMSAEKFRWLRRQVVGWGAVGEAVGRPLTLQQFREYFRQLALDAGVAATRQDTDETAEAVFADATDVIKFSHSEGLDREALAASRTTFPLLDLQNRVVGGVHLPPAGQAA